MSIILYRDMGKTGVKLSVLGYGCMRFPQKFGRIDEVRTERQVISAIKQGVNYFDTAYTYNGGESERVLGKILSKGYRQLVKIATKLPPYMVHSRNDMDRILETQLKRLNTDHIDFYLVHSLQDIKGWERLKQLGILEFIAQAKSRGKILYAGFSYHGGSSDFKYIIDDFAWDFCQIQYNYLDEYSQAGREGLEYAKSKGLGVIIMEPLRGGYLAKKLPPEVQDIWNRAEVKRTPAEWALRWVWNHSEVTTVLSGMNEEKHIDENIGIAQEAYPQSLSDGELEMFKNVKEAFCRLTKVGCTKCGYCVPCPAGINIPRCFEYYNKKHMFNEHWRKYQYILANSGILGGKPSYASLCKGCGKCEKVCPQALAVRKHLGEVAKDMESISMKPFMLAAGKYYKIRSRSRCT